MLYTICALLSVVAACDEALPVNTAGCADYQGSWNTNIDNPVYNPVAITQTGCTGEVRYENDSTNRVQWTFTVTNGMIVSDRDGMSGQASWGQILWEAPFDNLQPWGTSCEPTVSPTRAPFATPIGCDNKPAVNAQGCMNYAGSWNTNVANPAFNPVIVSQTGCVGFVRYEASMDQVQWTFTVDPATGKIKSDRGDDMTGHVEEALLVWEPPFDHALSWGESCATTTTTAPPPATSSCPSGWFEHVGQNLDAEHTTYTIDMAACAEACTTGLPTHGGRDPRECHSFQWSPSVTAGDLGQCWRFLEAAPTEQGNRGPDFVFCSDEANLPVHGVDLRTRMSGLTEQQAQNSGAACTQAIGQTCRVTGVEAETDNDGRRRSGSVWVVTYLIEQSTAVQALQLAETLAGNTDAIREQLSQQLSDDLGVTVQVLEIKSEATPDTLRALEDESSPESDDKADLLPLWICIAVVGGCLGGVVSTKMISHFFTVPKEGKPSQSEDLEMCGHTTSGQTGEAIVVA